MPNDVIAQNITIMAYFIGFAVGMASSMIWMTGQVALYNNCQFGQECPHHKGRDMV